MLNASTSAASKPAPKLLLLDTQYMRRRTIALAARELNLADVIEAASFAAAIQMLKKAPYTGLLLEADADCAGLELVSLVREKETASAANTPVAVITDSCSQAFVTGLQGLSISSVIVSPTTVRAILRAMTSLLSATDA